MLTDVNRKYEMFKEILAVSLIQTFTLFQLPMSASPPFLGVKSPFFGEPYTLPRVFICTAALIFAGERIGDEFCLGYV